MKIPVILAVGVLAFAHSVHAHEDHDHESSVNESTPELVSQNYRNIQTEALNRLIHSANPSVIIVDSRPVEFDDGKRIPGARVVPHNETNDKLSASLPDKDAIIIVYCTNAQCPASQFLAERLIQMGYKNVWKYTGGLEEWEAKGLAVEKGKAASEVAKNL